MSNLVSKKDCVAIILIAVVYAALAIYWPHSPAMTQVQPDQRQRAIEFLQRHQFQMDGREVNEVMNTYGITWDDIRPPDLRGFKEN